jgi:dTDP-4-amino-4,6-dideoxygalactose transaminase
MPTADALLPYLRRIDAARVYSNRGPLVDELERHLETLVGAPTVTTTNGTDAIELALRALGVKRGSLIAMPAMTFVGTGQAVQHADYRMALFDVDARNWQLSPDTVRQAMRAGFPIRAVVVVAAFGIPVPIAPWDDFARETGLPVVIDAAGAIADQKVSERANTATTYSLHATKFIGAGEGGFVASHNRHVLDMVRRLSTFGHGGRNAKMSEYHAAVALACTRPAWLEERARLTQQVGFWYVQQLDGFYDLPTRGTFSTLLPVLLPNSVRACDAIAAFAAAGIGSKQWYRPFLDELPQFGAAPRPAEMPVTQALRERMVGLPFHTSLTREDVLHVCNTLRDIVNEHTAPDPSVPDIAVA